MSCRCKTDCMHVRHDTCSHCEDRITEGDSNDLHRVYISMLLAFSSSPNTSFNLVYRKGRWIKTKFLPKKLKTRNTDGRVLEVNLISIRSRRLILKMRKERCTETKWHFTKATLSYWHARIITHNFHVPSFCPAPSNMAHQSCVIVFNLKYAIFPSHIFHQGQGHSWELMASTFFLIPYRIIV